MQMKPHVGDGVCSLKDSFHAHIFTIRELQGTSPYLKLDSRLEIDLSSDNGD